MHAGVILGSFLLAGAQNPTFRMVAERDALIAGTKGYLVGLPIHVAGPAEIESQWSLDGEFLAIKMTSMKSEDRLKFSTGIDVPMRTTFHVWNARTQQLSEIYRQAPNENLYWGGWMGGSTALFFMGTRELPSGPTRDAPETLNLVLSWKPGETRARQLASSTENLVVGASPTKPYAVVQTYFKDRRAAEAQVLIGNSLRTIVIPAKTHSRLDADGFICFVTRTVSDTTPKTVTEGWHRLQLDGRLVALTGPQKGYVFGNPDPNGLQILVTSTVPTAGAAKAAVNSGWLWMAGNGKSKSVLVAADADKVELSPDGRYVSYLTRGNLMVRKVSAMTPEDFEEMEALAEREKLLTRVKQLGTSMAIYHAKNDDLFPPKAGWEAAIYPIIRTRDMMDGFVYLMNGESAVKIDDPRNTPVGYIDGKYGRATVYADTSARWERKGTK